MKSSFLVFSVLFLSSFFILSSCGSDPDPKAEAISYFETIRYDVYIGSNDAMTEQNGIIQAYMDAMKENPGGDVMDELEEVIKAGRTTIDELEKGIRACDELKDFGDKAGLRVGTKNYMTFLLLYQNELMPKTEALRGPFDLVNFMEFRKELNRGQEIEAIGVAYKQVQSDFRKEYGITELDGVKMRARH